MKSIKVLSFIIGAIALFPSVSHAGNVSANNQVVDFSSTTVGDHNVNSTKIRQAIFDNQKAGRHGENVSGTTQSVTGHTETLGDGNIHIQDIKQKYGSRQKAK
jgi:hypothetical protein